MQNYRFEGFNHILAYFSPFYRDGEITTAFSDVSDEYNAFFCRVEVCGMRN
jgi:hypothetical protein